MSKLVWVALGAAGGVLAYRKGQQLLVEAKEKGVVGSMQAVTGSTAGLAAQARQLMAPRPNPAAGSARRSDPGTGTGPSGAAAARVLAQSRATTPAPNANSGTTSPQTRSQP